MLKETSAFALRWSGVPFLIRHTVARTRASILLYHDPPPSLLDRHLSYLARHYNFVSLTLLVESIRSGDWSRMPPRPLAVTLDDGHAGNFSLLEVFKRYAVVPTIFVCTKIVGTLRHFWFQDARDGFDSLVDLPNEERLRVLRQKFDFDVDRDYGPEQRQALTVEELALMSPYVEFGSHTRYHPTLTTCQSAECEEEIAGSKAELEELLGLPCKHFSYPNGDYSDREVELAKRCGYLSARTADVGWNSRNTDPFRLRVVGIGDDTSLNMLTAQLSGIRFLRSRAKGNVWRRRSTRAT